MNTFYQCVCSLDSDWVVLTLLHSEQPKFHRVLAILSAVELKHGIFGEVVLILKYLNLLPVCHTSPHNTQSIRRAPGKVGF